MADGTENYVGIIRSITSNQPRGADAAATFRSFLGKAFRWLLGALVVLTAVAFVGVFITKQYETSDDNPWRGAAAISDGKFDESYAQPMYVEQGWEAGDSLWFYNTTQGSALLPYDFFLELELPDNETKVRSDTVIDAYRYLPQVPTKFNPDGLPVGFVRENYQGADYVGYTCAACHTGQINFGGQAIRIDGGPAMADMDEFLATLERSMRATLSDADKFQRFAKRVIDLRNDFRTPDRVRSELEHWTATTRLYNTVNHVDKSSSYGYARLDAFGRIYNRVLQHAINNEQAADILSAVVGPTNNRILSDAQIALCLAGMNETIMGDSQFTLLLERLQSNEPGYPGLNQRDMIRILRSFFNEPDAPVSYPFLWDIAQSDYVQWNGIANNAALGPLGRNAGEVIGVFGKLDWTESTPGFFSAANLAAYISGQKRKAKKIKFTSSIDLHNLRRLESRLKSLQSPLWSDAMAKLAGAGVDVTNWQIDDEMADKGRLVYRAYCQSCHEVIDRDNWDRLVVARMTSLENVGTDPKMATNSVTYTGKSGNFADTIQATDVGPLVVEETAPVVQILTSATKGVVATPSADKSVVRNFAEWLYTVISSIADNKIQVSNKAGNYTPDTTANPYASLVSYKARSLNGIWATAPYLHNGSVPTLYDLLLPARRDEDPADGEYRPDDFVVGSRVYDPIKVGFRSSGFDGFTFDTSLEGNSNAGHEYSAGRTRQMNGKTLPALDADQRRYLLEYLKTL